MTREHDSMQKNPEVPMIFNIAVVIGPDFPCLDGVPEGSGSRTEVGNLNPMLEMDSAHSKTYLGKESMFTPKFFMSWK